MRANLLTGSAFVTSAGFLLVVTAMVALGRLPWLVLVVYLGMSVLTFAVYAVDKSAAQKGRWRTPENTLHILALLGGWPGGLYAQQVLRHKSSKTSFRVVFWITVVLNVSVLLYWVWVYGA